MKKICSTLVLALFCICSAWAQQDTIKVSTAKELSDALENHADESNVVIKLMKDIDVSTYEDFKRASVLKATIDGYYYAKDSLGNVEPNPTGYMIKNLKRNLVNAIEGGKVKGIQIVGGEQGGWMWKNPAFLAIDAENAEITDVIIIACKYDQSSFGGDGYDSKGGLLVDEIKNSKVSGVVIIACSMNCDGYEIGAIAGTASKTTFTECSTDASTVLYTEKEPNAYIGGLVGSSEECTFEKCTNAALVAACEKSDNVGGITGSCTLCTFTNCVNDGVVCQMNSQNMHLLNQRITPYAKVVGVYFSTFQILQFIRARTATWHGASKLMKIHSMQLKSGQTNIKGFKQWFHEYYGDLSAAERFPIYKIRLEMEAEKSAQNLNYFISYVMIALAVYDVCMRIYDLNDPDEVGGISSVSYGSTFTYCTNSGMVSSRDAYCGGIVGYADLKNGQGTQIINCMNVGYIQGDEQSSGIVGYMKKGGKVTNCLNVGTIDCVTKCKNAIYGDTDAEKSFLTNCFVMEHGVDYQTYKQSGETIKFGYQDIAGGRAAYEMNRIIGKDVFRQEVGEERYPNIFGDHIVQQSDIRDDVDLKYYVNCREAFVTAMTDQYADIVIEDDIDMENTYFSAYRNSCKFHGSIDGQGHIMKNIKADVNDTENNFDKDNVRHAMFGFAENASFKNLTIDSLTLKHGIMIAGLVGNSKNCTYEDINIKNSELYAYNSFIGGLVYESNQDTFTRCTTDGNTKVSTHGLPAGKLYAYAGGLVSQAKGSTFTDCVNGAIVSGRLDVVGGIVALDEGSTFTRCINKGYIHHDSSLIQDNDELGGIVAEAEFSKFYECINTGNLDCDDENCGGIVGLGTNVTIINCLNAAYNLMSIQKANTCGGIIGYAKNSMVANCASIADRPIIGDFSDINVSSGNNYRVKISNDRSNEWEVTVDEKTMKSGIVCRWLNNGTENRKERRTVWHQLLKGWYSDDIPFPTSDGHPEVLASDLPHTDISSADDLIAFANAVNNGEQFKVGVLTNDIVMPEGTTWEPIGTNDHPFRGIFDGRGFTINNLKINKSGSGTQAAGLFGVIDVFADINNVIIGKDSEITTNISGNEHGSAGIVGIYLVSKRRWWGNASIRNCGSYANVTATKHTAAILGRVIADVNETHEKTSPFIKLYIDSCFNAGTITASNGNSALLCGYARDHAVVRDCWSAGHLVSTGSGNAYELNSNGDNEYFVGYNQTVDIKDCVAAVDLFDVSQKGVTKYSEEVAYSGQLTYMLNGNDNNPDHKLRWKQDISKDAAPISCRINIGTPEEMILDNKGVTYSRSISEPYGALVLPYSIRSNNDYDLFTLKEVVEEDDGIVTTFYFTHADEVPACTPMLYRVKENGNYEFDDIQTYYNFSFEVRTPDQWNFTGTFKGRSFTMGATHVFHVITTSDGTGAMFANTPNITIPPFTAFFYGPNIYDLLAAGKTNRVILEEKNGTATSISSLPTGEGRGEASYTLMGTKAPAGYKGIVIKNGRKVVNN